jgi:hypothetical protein
MSKKRKKTQPTAPGIPPGDQQILDEICDAVAGQGGYGMTDWTIGKTDDVVEYVAARLGRKPHAVSRGLDRLVERGLFATDCHEPWDPDEAAPLLGWISVEEAGWRQWTLWDQSDEQMIQFGSDQFEADPIWVAAGHAELAEGADRFRRGYRGRGTPPAECLDEALAEHFRTFFGDTEGPDAGKKRDAKTERLRRLIDWERLVSDIAAAREADIEGVEDDAPGMAERLVSEAACHLPGPPAGADLHLVCLPDMTAWEEGEVPFTPMARLVGDVLLADGRRYDLQLGLGSGGWYYACREQSPVV